jgi:hypothetical protein
MSRQPRLVSAFLAGVVLFEIFSLVASAGSWVNTVLPPPTM